VLRCGVARALAFVALAALLLWVFRFAMELRGAKRRRERARAAAEAAGRRVLAEIPVSERDVVLLTEDDEGFAWGSERVAKKDVSAARLLLSGAVVQEFAQAGAWLPPPAVQDEVEERERWEVAVYTPTRELRIPCGSLREGVSRDIAHTAFQALQRAAMTRTTRPESLDSV
jgi:hypothetical protein